MLKSQTTGRVYIVGAGPGDPALLTLRAVECLRRADLVIYDRLVNPRILDFAPQASHRSVPELVGSHRDKDLRIPPLLIAEARKGRCVVRLKGGDPSIFGRTGEEVQHLREAGVLFEIVPGVTAALGASAYGDFPLTHRLLGSAVALVAGHECPDKPELLDWVALARFPGTLVFYMALKRLETIAEQLILHGKPADSPAAVVQDATLPGQRVVTASLQALAEQAAAAGLRSPALVLVGPTISLHRPPSWFEARPLFGKGVLVTRPREQTDELCRRLEELGASVYRMPTVQIGPAPDPTRVTAVCRRLDEYDWLVFTSANGVSAFLQALSDAGLDARSLGTCKLAAIGPKTARALHGCFLKPDITAAETRSEGLAEALREPVRGKRVLLAAADRGREVLRDQLAAIAQVEFLPVYSQQELIQADPEVLAALQAGRIHFAFLTSGNIARALWKALDESSRSALRTHARLVSLSPLTSEVIRELGLEVACEAASATVEEMIEAVLRWKLAPKPNG